MPAVACLVDTCWRNTTVVEAAEVAAAGAMAAATRRRPPRRRMPRCGAALIIGILGAIAA